MRNKKYLLSIVATGLLAFSASAQSVPVLQENFMSGNRFEQSPPSTTAWYSSGESSAVTYAGNGKLSVDTQGKNTFLLTYFTASGSPVTLSRGDSLKLDFKVSFDGITGAAGAIRFGLFNSGGSRIASDDIGFASPTYNGYTGYAAYFNPGGAGSDAGTIRKRDKTHNTLINGNNAFTNLGNGGSLDALVDNTVYAGMMLINYKPDGAMVISVSINGMELTLPDNAAPSVFTSFDTFVITGMQGSATSITLSEVVITHNIAIPEAGMTGLILAALVTGGIFYKQRKARKNA